MIMCHKLRAAHSICALKSFTTTRLEFRTRLLKGHTMVAYSQARSPRQPEAKSTVQWSLWSSVAFQQVRKSHASPASHRRKYVQIIAERLFSSSGDTPTCMPMADMAGCEGVRPRQRPSQSPSVALSWAPCLERALMNAPPRAPQTIVKCVLSCLRSSSES